MVKQLATVLANKLNIEEPTDSKAALILESAPIDSIIPPKTIAQMINQIVPSIPSIPPETNKSFKEGCDVSIETPVVIELIKYLYISIGDNERWID